ncbi:MAG: fibronectin type III domain-containing protein, partial [bacterium]
NYQTDWYQTDPFKVAYTVLPTNFTVDNLTVTKFSDITYGSTINVTNTFLIDQYSYFSSTGSTTTNTLSVLNNSILYNQSTASFVYSTLNWTGAGLVDNGGTFAFLSGGGDLTVPATSTLESNVPRSYTNVTINGLLTHNANTTAESYKINFTVSGNTTVNAGGSINANGKGFSMGNGPGAGVSGTVGAGGGSYGGVGGDGQYRAGSLVIYGNQLAPDRLGSGGGKYDYSTSSGSGGGAIKIYSKGNLVVNGTIYANGTHSVVDWNHPPGGGSGGSIWLVGNNVSGSGSITANGANTPDTNYDGGAGGGGRIAIYYVTNSSGLAALTANKGIASGAGAKSGGNGTVYLGGITADPVNLRQYKIDGVTAIAQGGITSESSIVTTLQVQDGDLTDTLTPQVEIKPVGTAFNNVPTDVGTPVAYNGSIITASVSVVGLANNESYHWQARVCDASSNCTGWISYGSNLESEADISIVTNADPNSPLIPDSSFFINGQYTNSLQPTLGFVLSDPNNTDSVQYRIQLAADNTFNTLILDYSSEFAAQGTRLYSIGQTTGTGVYHTGNEDMQLAEGNYYWKVQTIDDKEGESGWSVAPGTPSFRIDLSKPSNATYAFMKPYKDAINQYNYDDPPLWFNRNDLFFSWQEGTDLQGVKGYCLYLGPKSDGNPATEKGILGTSPISTTGSDCQFITDTTEIDFANPSYRGSDWLTSSMDRYFFKIKTIDISNNVFEGPDDSNVVPLYFDNTLPQNVTAISAASGTFSSTAEMYFNWPIVAGQNGSDEHSGLLGFQYSLNSKNIEDWIGDVVDDHTSLSYSLMTKSQPVYFPEAVQNLVQIGQNIIYFRTIDRAGNFSELRTAYINYGGEAPKFAQGEEVRVVPTQNNINRFAFEWNAAIPSDGNAIKSYYYMLNTVPPASYATIISNSATYRPTNDTNVPEANFAGLRRGANTIHVIAVDTLDNYSPTNFITATFFLNSDLPDPVNNLTVSDSSIKDASIWRVALVWDLPDYRGTGDLTYHIERSENSTDWSEIDSTTGLAYIDVVGESKRYYWRVSTTDTSDQSIATPSYTNAVSIIPKGSYTTPPTLTSGPASSSITTTTALITWTTNRTGDSKVAFGLAPSNYFDSETYKSSHVTEHKIQLSNLTPGTTYYFTAKWTDEDGNTGISEEQSFTTAPPPQVKDVRLSNLGISSVMVNFTTINANKARIYYGTSTSFGGIKDIGTSKLETAYTIELNQLNDGTKYYYKINTFDEENKEYEGTILDFTTLPRPRVSEIVVQQVINTAQSTLLVTWQSNTLVTSVVTFYPEANEELARDIVELKLVKGEHKILIKGLFPQMAYVIRVSGKDIIGNEAVSDPIRIITATDSRAPYISAMTIEGSNTTQMSGVSPNTSSQLIVSWTTDEPSTSQVEFGEGSGITYNQLTQEDTDLSYNHVVIVSGLTPSKVYHVRSISKDAAGNVSKSIDTLTITPKATDNAFDMVITILRESFGFLTK